MDFSRLFTVVVLPACFLLGHSALVHGLFLLFSSINHFSSHQFRSIPSIISAVLSSRSASVCKFNEKSTASV